MREEPINKCPKCKGKVRRLIGSGAGIIFKGSGFYATDYRSASYKREAEKEKGDACRKSKSCPLDCPKKDSGQS
jgi:predicted nucleic acid-binding Zn ribbon protein